MAKGFKNTDDIWNAVQELKRTNTNVIPVKATETLDSIIIGDIFLLEITYKNDQDIQYRAITPNGAVTNIPAWEGFDSAVGGSAAGWEQLGTTTFTNQDLITINNGITELGATVITPSIPSIDTIKTYNKNGRLSQISNDGIERLIGGNFGFFDYNDLATATIPISVVGGAGFVFLTNDGLGAFTNKLYPPIGVTDVWNATLNQFDFTQLTLGSKIEYRLDIEVTTSSVNQEIDLEFELAIGGFNYSLSLGHQQFKSTGTYKINLHNFIYMGDLNTKDNPAKFKISSDGNLDVKVNGWACFVHLF